MEGGARLALRSEGHQEADAHWESLHQHIRPAAETLITAYSQTQRRACMSFCEQLRRKAQHIWNAQLTHPFVVALGKGTLPERKFKYYILQDARFLGDLARVFAAAAHKAPDAESGLRFAKLVEETIVVERGLHERYGSRWKMSSKQMTSVPMAPTNYAYTRHMLTVAQTGTAAEITVVALPCAWIYCVVGQHLLRKGPPRAGHPYRDWLMLYASPEFAEVGAIGSTLGRSSRG